MIYLDNAATTPVDPIIFKKILSYFSKDYANPASVHSAGQASLKAVDDARYLIAELLHITGNEIVFTSGATEANNLVLKGIANLNPRQTHIITTKIEHSSILEPCHYLESKGVKVTYLDVNSQGLVDPEKVIKAITPQTKLISIGYVNSETGIVQPIKKIGRLLKKYNEQRLKTWLNTPARNRNSKPQMVLLHTDATQALQYFNCQPQFLHVDFMSLSAHKIYGPKGCGLIFIRSGIDITPLLHGGHQEKNMRSGTVNVPAVVGFAEALKIAFATQTQTNKKISHLRDQLLKIIQKNLPGIHINTTLSQASPSHLNISYQNLEGDIIQAKMDEKKVMVSTGSACASGDSKSSHVLAAMKLDKSLIQGSIRFSVGKNNTLPEIKTAARVYIEVIKKLRKV
jgi:cysteine desulfurase